MDYEEMAKNLAEQNHTSVPFPISFSELREAADAFMDFLTLPLEEKVKFSGWANSKMVNSELGYRFRQKGSDQHKDNKEFFQYNLVAKEQFASLAEDSYKARTFLSKAHSIYCASEETMRSIINELDRVHPGLYSSYFPENEYPDFYLRFLKYDVTPKNGVLAAGHYDFGGCTLALAESNPGLRIGKNEKTLKEVEHSDGQALFMSGYSFPELTRKDFLPAWHDVIQKGNTSPTDTRVSRWAIVMFANYKGMPEPDHAMTHTPAYY